MSDAPTSRFRRWRHPIPIIGVSLWALTILAAAYIVVWCYTAAPTPVSHTAEMEALVKSAQPGGSMGPAAPFLPDATQPPPDLTGRAAWEALEAVLADFSARTATVAPSLDFTLLTDGYQQELDRFPPPESSEELEARLADVNARRAVAATALSQIAGSPLDDLLRRLAATHGGARQAYGATVASSLLPDLGQTRRVARYLYARARTAAGAGDPDQAFDAIEWAMALARVHAFQGTLISRLVAIAIAQGALGELRLAIDQDLLDAPSARRALQILERQGVWPDMRVVWEGERLVGYECISMFYTRGGMIPGRFLPVEHENFLASGGPVGAGHFEPLRNITGIWAPSRTAAIRELDRNIDVAISLGGTTRPARRALGDPFAPPPGSRAASAILGPLVPAYAQSQWGQDHYQAVLAGLRTRLALIIHYGEHAQWPESLDDLVPSVLPALPIDPFSFDGRLIYRREGDSFALYSVGNDGQDDGGTFDPDRWQEGFMRNISGLDVRFGPPNTP